MVSRHLALVIALALFGAQAHTAQDRPATVAGVVRDTYGIALPGVTLSVTLPSRVPGLDAQEVKAVTDSHGRYSISVPPGSHTISATRYGVYSDERQVQLTPGATATVNFDLKRGPTRSISWLMPPESLSELLATAHTVAHVRVTGTTSAGACRREAQITTRVITGIKPPELATGATLAFCQEQWESEPTTYPAGTELVVLLTEWKNGAPLAPLVRSHGPYAVFLVENGKIEASRFLYTPYRSYAGMPVAHFLAELSAMNAK